jgi:hypothetical protein
MAAARVDHVPRDRIRLGIDLDADGGSSRAPPASANVVAQRGRPAGVGQRHDGRVRPGAGTFGGNVKINGNDGFLLLGDPADDGCNGNAFNSGVTLGSNTARLALVGNKIASGVSITGNSGSGPAPAHTSPKVGGNTINGNLACSGNSPVMTNGGSSNSVSGNKSGECASL